MCSISDALARTCSAEGHSAHTLQCYFLQGTMALLEGDVLQKKAVGGSLEKKNKLLFIELEVKILLFCPNTFFVQLKRGNKKEECVTVER